VCRRFESCRARPSSPYFWLRTAFPRDGGDWGDLDCHNRRANERALRDGARLLSAYDTEAGRVWIVTEADRSTTTVPLPSEY
jgi:hypothetical protein